VLITIYAFVVEEYESLVVKSWVEASGAVIGTLILGVLLVFRMNTANDRWWEGRKLWGQLVNDSRNMAIKACQYLPSAPAYCQEIRKILVAFPVALKEHLRDGVSLKSLPGFEQTSDNPAHVPLYLAQRLYATTTDCKLEGLLDVGDQQVMDFHSRALMDICGACERIKSSPIPVSYRMILRHSIVLSILGLPWYLAPDFHLWGVPIILVFAYFLIGVEMIAEEIEQPFNPGRDTLPLEKICAVIETTVNQVLAPAD
jgi:putative membrane protein